MDIYSVTELSTIKLINNNPFFAGERLFTRFYVCHFDPDSSGEKSIPQIRENL